MEKFKGTKGDNVFCEGQPNNIGILVDVGLIDSVVNFGTKRKPITRTIQNCFLVLSKYSQEQLDAIEAAAPELLEALLMAKHEIETGGGRTPRTHLIPTINKAINKALN